LWQTVIWGWDFGFSRRWGLRNEGGRADDGGELTSGKEATERAVEDNQVGDEGEESLAGPPIRITEGTMHGVSAWQVERTPPKLFWSPAQSVTILVILNMIVKKIINIVVVCALPREVV
jgi:hypothetical protein